MSSRVIVVGAGLVGLCTAIALRKRGVDVLVLEKAVAGAQASSAAGGILSPQAECDAAGAMLDLCLLGLTHTRALVAELQQRTGIDIELDNNGTAVTAVTEDERRALDERMRWQTERGLAVQWLVRGETALFPDEGRLDPVRYVQACAAATRAMGARVEQHGAIARIATTNGRATGVVLDNGSELGADAVCLCAGAWSAHITGSGLSPSWVFPVRGQMIELDGSASTLERTTFVNKSYAIPRRSGGIVVGSTLEYVGFDARTTEEGLGRVVREVERAFPQLRGMQVKRTWAGLRPGSRDGFPLLGVSGAARLFVGAGHFRNGVLLAAASGDVLARLVVDEPLTELGALDWDAFSPQRFGVPAEQT